MKKLRRSFAKQEFQDGELVDAEDDTITLSDDTDDFAEELEEAFDDDFDE